MLHGRRALLHECLAELTGTFILVFFGVGAVHAAVLTEMPAGLWQVAIIWGIAVALAIYAVGAVSGAHLNPAITLAFATLRRFPVRKILPFVLSQVLGSFLAAALLYALFHNLITQFEAAHAIQRGLPGSELSAMVYGEYFPNPALLGATATAFVDVTLGQAMLAEAVGAAFLAFFIFALTDGQNRGRLVNILVPVMIGLALSIIIAIIAPLTQAGLNPARDFGPRLFAFFAGWGHIAIPGPRGGFFTVYTLGPILGAQAGALVYQFVIRPALARAPQDVPIPKEVA